MDLEKLREYRDTGFTKDVGLEFTEMKEGYAKGELVLQSKHWNPLGSVHGGVLFTIADTVAGTAATSRGRYVTTMTGDINYLRPAMNCKKLIGESREIKTGKQVCVYDCIITDENGREIAIARMTYHYLDHIAGEDFLSKI